MADSLRGVAVWCAPRLLAALLVASCAAPDGPPIAPSDPVDTGSDLLRFALPLDEPARFEQVVGVDHDPAVYTSTLLQATCADYLGRGFPHCYDEHRGSDFLLVGGFPSMDAGSPAVLAAADGVVEVVVDGNYDRCHATLEGVDCDGHPMVANRVVLLHGDGTRTSYLHLQRGSVVVRVGQEVARGTPLGRVGSSGVSSMPHLHFEVQRDDGVVVDPFAGPGSQPRSWWCAQGGPDDLPGPCEAG